MMEERRCIECGRGFLVTAGQEVGRCEDCMPQTGRGSLLMDRFSINLLQLREAAGMTRAELADRAAMSVDELSQYERGVAREPGVDRALRLAHSLGVGLDRLTERIYWNPGEVAPTRPARRGPSERLAGFFLVLPPNVPPFEPAPPREPVANRHEAAELFGQNLRDARERRHLSQQQLAGSAGLSKAGLSLIERGAHETTIEVLLSFARSLQVAPEALLSGIGWEPEWPLCSDAGRSRAQRHRPSSLDELVRRLWGEGKTAREIGEALDASPGAVSAIVHRLREHGGGLPYRNRPTRPEHEAARRRRTCQQARQETPAKGNKLPQTAIGEPDAVEASATDPAAQIGGNLAHHRHARGLTLEQLGEAIELDRSYVHRTEKGRHLPRLSTAMKLAAGLNVRCEAITAGVAWEPGRAEFRVHPRSGGPLTPAKRLGDSVLKARRRAGISQETLAARARIGRGDVGDFERGKRTSRIFTAVRLAGALDLSPAELFTDTVDFYVRPLPPPQYAPGDQPPTKVERDREMIRLWREGKSEREIAEALDLTVAAIGPYIRDLRDAGVELPYRRPPRRSAEVAARRRRGK